MSERIVLSELGKFRKEIGFTQDELAGLVDVTVRTVQRIESGNATSLSTAKSIASVLELPSYKVMVKEEEKHEMESETQLPKLKSRVKKNYDLLLGKLKTGHTQQVILALFTILSVFYVAGREPSLVVLSIVTMLPVITVAVIVNEKSINSQDKVPSLNVLFSLLVLLLVSNVSLIALVILSMLGEGALNSQSYINILSMSPGPVTAIDVVVQYSQFIKSLAAVVFLFSILSFHYLVYKERQKNHSFLYYSNVYGGIFVYSIIATSPLKLGVIPNFNPLVYSVIVGVIFVVGAVYGYLKYANNRGKKVTYLMGAMSILIPGLVASYLIGVGGSYYQKKVVIGLDYAEKSVHCESNRHESICWDARLLEKHGIPVNEDSLTMVSAKNGNTLAMLFVMKKYNPPKEVFLNGEPVPYLFGQFFAKAQKRALEYRDSNGVVENYLLEANDNDRDPHGLFELMLDKSEYLKLVNLAVSDQDEFIKSYQMAPKWLKEHIYLKELYIMMSGTWKIYNYGDEVSYSAGRLSVFFKDGVINRYEKGLDNNVLKKIALIPESELPTFKVAR